MNATDMLLETTVFFALILALSLVIERLMEVMKVVFDYVDGRWELHHYWTRRTRALKEKLERRIRALTDPAHGSALLRPFRDYILNERGAYRGKALVLSADTMRTLAVRFAAKVIGLLIGVGMAFWLDIDLVKLYHDLDGSALDETGVPKWLRLTVSGSVMGLGSGPVHKLITTIERAQKNRSKQAKEA